MRFLALALLVLAGVPAAAGEACIPIPDRLRVGSDLVAVRGERIAVGMRPKDDEQRKTTLVQIHGEQRSITTFEGKLMPVAYSPDGELLYAMQILPSAGRCCGCPTRKLFLDAEGGVIWQDDLPHPGYRFSTTGQVVYSGLHCETGGCGGLRLEIRDTRTGEHLKTVDPGRRFVHAIVLGSGEDIVFFYPDGMVERVIAGERIIRDWATQIAEPYGNGQHRTIGSDKALIEQGRGRFTVVDTKGQVVYTYDADALAAEDLDHDADYYRGFGFREGPPDRVWLKGVSGELLLDLKTGRFEPFDPRYLPDSGYPHVRGRHQVVIGEGCVRVQELW